MVPLTGCFQASLPACGQMIAFSCNDDSGRLVVADEDAFQRRLHDIFEVDDAEKISGVRSPDGTTAQPEDLKVRDRRLQ